MRVFSQGQLARGLARALMVAFVWSMLCSGIVAVPAGAQVPTRSTSDQSTAVVPFYNQSAYHPETYGDEVAALVATDLEERLLLDVLDAGEVTLEMKNLGMKVPLDTPALVRLATQLDVKMMVYGDIREARVVMDKGGRYGQVTIGVHLFSRLAQGDVNGALITAHSPSDALGSADELIANALKQAVFQAIGEMKTRPAVTASVIFASGDQIFTNVGTRGGIMTGMKLVAVRGQQKIAEVLVTEARATGSDGKVISGSQLRTGDFLLALYQVPGEGPPLSMKEKVTHQAQGLERLGVYVGVAAILLGVARTSRQVLSGNYNLPNFQVSALANAEGNPGVMSFPLLGPCNLLTWTKYSNTQSRRVLGYVIYRSDVPIFLVMPQQTGGNTVYIDDAWPRPGLPGTVHVDFSFSIDSLTGLVAGANSPGTIYAPDANGNPTYDAWLNGLFLGIYYEDYFFEAGLLMEGPLPNYQEYYRVQPIVTEQRSSDPDIPDWHIVFAANESTPSNPTTGVPAALTDQAMLVGSVATFSFYHPGGADECELQVQRDQGASGPIDFAPGPALYQTVVTGLNPNVAGDIQRIQVNFAALQALQGTSDIYWWRIGCRRRGDALMPRAYPINPNSPDNGWVWTFPVARIVLAPSMNRAAETHPRTGDRALSGSGERPLVRPGSKPNRPLHTQ